MSRNSILHSFKKWFRDMWRFGIGFLLALIASGGADILIDIQQNISITSTYTGVSLSFHERLLQYLAFFPDCFLSPSTYILETGDGRISWWLTPRTEISLFGILLLILAAIGFLLNRKDTLSQVSVFWVGYSFVVLCLIGWGTAENGLILYALYFIWAVYILLFKLLDTICGYMKQPYALPAICCMITIAMGLINFSGLYELIRFAIQYYPV